VQTSPSSQTELRRVAGAELCRLFETAAMRRYCRRLGIADPDEVLGHVYLGVCRRLREPPRNLRAWLWRHSCGLVADYAREESYYRIRQPGRQSRREED